MLFDENQLKQDLQDQVARLKQYLKQVRTGRAKPSQFEEVNVKVAAYGNQAMELRSLATVGLDGPTSIIISPFDPNTKADIMKSVQEATELNPVDEGDKIRVNVPGLTEETRKQIVKDMYQELEESFKKRVRQIRQDYMHKIEAQKEEAGVSENEVEASKNAVQKQIDEINLTLDETAKEKEAEVMDISS